MANKDNIVFVRLPLETLARLDEIVEDRQVKNRQAIVKEAIAAYLASYKEIKSTYINRVNQSQLSPN